MIMMVVVRAWSLGLHVDRVVGSSYSSQVTTRELEQRSPGLPHFQHRGERLLVVCAVRRPGGQVRRVREGKLASRQRWSRWSATPMHVSEAPT